MPTTNEDLGIKAVREVRERISSEWENDPAQIVGHYLTEQDRFRDRLLKTESGPRPAATNGPPDGDT